MTKRTRGRPRGYIAPENCPVTDADAFVELFQLLRDHAAPQPRGGASFLAYVLDVSHVLVVQYCRKAPRGITPALFSALERAPLMLQRYPFAFDEYFALLERAVDGDNGEGTPAPHTAFRWLPASKSAVLLEDHLGPVVHNMRRTGNLSASRAQQLPRDQWLLCTPEDAAILRRALVNVPSCSVSEQRDGDSVLLMLHELP